ncbi:MAG: carbonic anhydrase [Sphingomonas sp.]|nr:carbonic anhydrase [Sphingomonas sp.]
MLQGAGLTAAAFTAAPVLAAPGPAVSGRGPTPSQALAILKKGNADFLAGKPIPIDTNGRRRLAIAKSQHPFAVLVSCSDSRVPPEVLFGRGLGELFIVRNAGNTVDTAAMGSIEYAVAELKVPLVVVMGHERCGAVAAALSVVQNNTAYPGSIGRMIESIVPAVLQARSAGADWLDASVKSNVIRTVTRLRTASEPLLLDPLRRGELKIVGARYDLDDGRVTFFE